MTAKITHPAPLAPKPYCDCNLDHAELLEAAAVVIRFVGFARDDAQLVAIGNDLFNRSATLTGDSP